MNRTQLVLKLFNPDERGISRWVKKEELIGEYTSLFPTNGNHWYRLRGLSHLIYEKKESDGTIYWRFNGIKKKDDGRPIKPEIRKSLKNNSCAHTGFKGTKNNCIVIDHKNGRYDDEKVLNIKTQSKEDFQALTNQANLYKRSVCIDCVKTGKRFDAKNLGFPISQIEGDEVYKGTCVGCYWYDCLRFKNNLMGKK
jgi:hypothetical protein